MKLKSYSKGKTYGIKNGQKKQQVMECFVIFLSAKHFQGVDISEVTNKCRHQC